MKFQNNHYQNIIDYVNLFGTIAKTKSQQQNKLETISGSGPQKVQEVASIVEITILMRALQPKLWPIDSKKFTEKEEP
jgi:hypothetical protein